MNQEDKIDTLVENLEYKIVEAKAVREVFPDTIVRVVDRVGIRYQSPTLNGCADKADLSWDFIKMYIRPYTQITFEYKGLARLVTVNTEPHEVLVATKVIDMVIPENYTETLTELSFSKNVIRMVDIDMADGILNKKWKVDSKLLTSKVKTFLTLS